MANNTAKNNVDEVNLAYQILKSVGQPLYYRELIDRVVAEKGSIIRPSAQTIAEIHTRINLDSRFVHTGKSMWGLSEWSPQRANLREVEEAAVSSQDDVRREKLLAAIQQDFDNEDADSVAETGGELLDEDSEFTEEEELEAN